MSRRIFFIVFVLLLGFAVDTDAQSRLYPTNRFSRVYSDSDFIDLKRYDLIFDELLLSDIENANFAFTVQPSWGAESSCSYCPSKSTFVLKVAEENLWYYYFGVNSEFVAGESPEVNIVEYRCVVPWETAKYFKELFSAAALSSSYLARPNGLDGVTYEIISLKDGWVTAGFWSPKKDTNCHKLEQILIQISLAVRSNDCSAIEELVPAAVELTAAFKELYPADVIE